MLLAGSSFCCYSNRVAGADTPKSASRVGALSCVLVAIAISYLVPDRYVFGGGWIAHTATLVLVIILGLSLLGHWLRLPTWVGNTAVLVVVAILLTVNILSLVKLIQLILFHVKDIDGHRLLGSSVVIWVSNVLAFSLLYWLIDGGGPDERLNSDIWHADFVFPQPIRRVDVNANWLPNFLDYLYLGFSTATAFSTTDTLPLTTRARMLMMVEAAASLLTIAITAARAVNILS
jgi:hypothetical protein